MRTDPPDPETPPTPPTHPLQRETVVVVQDRTKIALLTALCTVACVAAGFALGTVAGSTAQAAPATAECAELPAPPPSPQAHLHGGNGHWHYDWTPGWPNWDPGSIDIDIGGHGRGWLGVSTDSNPGGAKITQVQPGSPAAAVGLKVGDVITEVDGEQVATPAQLAAVIGNLDAGAKAKVHILRDGLAIIVEPTLGSRP